MNNTKKIALVSILAVGLGGMSIQTQAASDHSMKPLVKVKPFHKLKMKRHFHRRMPAPLTWRKALRGNKHYSATDAKVLAKAAILLYGDKAMTVNDVKSVTSKKGRELFIITISNSLTNQDQKLVMSSANGRMHAIRNLEKFMSRIQAK